VITRSSNSLYLIRILVSVNHLFKIYEELYKLNFRIVEQSIPKLIPYFETETSLFDRCILLAKKTLFMDQKNQKLME
jgi:hypothetical protein